MAIKYVGVKRVQGTEAERTATSLPAGTVTGWKLVGRTSLSSAAATPLAIIITMREDTIGPQTEILF